MVRGTIFSFVVAAFFFLAYLLSMQVIFAVLSIFMALFGAVLILLEIKERADKNIEDEYEDEDEDEDEDEEERTKPIEAVASI